MSKELSLALVQDPAAASVDEFRQRMRDLVRQYPKTSLFVFPEQHLLGAFDPYDQADLVRHAEPSTVRCAARSPVWLPNSASG